jgi:hypothetical protein
MLPSQKIKMAAYNVKKNVFVAMPAAVPLPKNHEFLCKKSANFPVIFK